MTICCIGAGPKHLRTGSNLEPLIALAKPWLEAKKPFLLLSGLQPGWGQAVAIAAMELGIPVEAYVAFVGQADLWGTQAQVDYQNLLRKCATIKVISPPDYEPWKIRARDEAMIDACDTVLSLWDGSDGDVGDAMCFAMVQGVEVENLYEIYELEL